MDAKALISKLALGLAVIALGGYSLNAQAFNSRGTRLDTECASLPTAVKSPQQSRPYIASGSDCAICHQPPGTTLALTPMGQAASINNPVTAMDPYCINTPPTAASITAPATDGTAVAPGATVTFTGSSTDPDGFALLYTWGFSDGTSLTGQTVTYTVPANAVSGSTITATLTVTDPDTAVSSTKPTRTITVSVAPPPPAPVANNDSYSVQSGATLTVAAPGVLANDTGTGTLQAVLASNVAHGSLSLAANGGFSYTPASGYTGTDSFTYKATNGTSTSANAATVSITVNAAPPPAVPVANNDSYSVQTGKSLQVAAPGVLANDTGSGSLTATIATQPSNASSFVLNANGGFSYTPKSGYSGNDSFTYRASNGQATSNAATVAITVIPSGPCTDKDADGYSPEGKSCGPVDCNDSNPRITTCVKTNACIDKLLANQVRIDSAVWDGEHKLTVAGSKAPKGATVKVYDAVSNLLLGSASVEDSGLWKLERELSASPCRVRADINGASGQLAVTGSPSSCTAVSEPPSCGEDHHEGIESEGYSDQKSKHGKEVKTEKVEKKTRR